MTNLCSVGVRYAVCVCVAESEWVGSGHTKRLVRWVGGQDGEIENMRVEREFWVAKHAQAGIGRGAAEGAGWQGMWVSRGCGGWQGVWGGRMCGVAEGVGY